MSLQKEVGGGLQSSLFCNNNKTKALGKCLRTSEPSSHLLKEAGICPAVATPAGLFRGPHEIMFVKVLCTLKVCVLLFIEQICIKHLCA